MRNRPTFGFRAFDHAAPEDHCLVNFLPRRPCEATAGRPSPRRRNEHNFDLLLNDLLLAHSLLENSLLEYLLLSHLLLGHLLLDHSLLEQVIE